MLRAVIAHAVGKRTPSAHGRYTRSHTRVISLTPYAPARYTLRSLTPPLGSRWPTNRTIKTEHGERSVRVRIYGASFMIKRRIAWNLDAFSGLVKKSAMLSSVRTKGTSISIASTMSLIQKCRRWTCFIRSWCSGLYDTSRAALLSVDRDEGPGSASPRPETSLRR